MLLSARLVHINFPLPGGAVPTRPTPLAASQDPTDSSPTEQATFVLSRHHSLLLLPLQLSDRPRGGGGGGKRIKGRGERNFGAGAPKLKI